MSEVVYVVGRADLEPGLRVAQVGHALIAIGGRGAPDDKTLIVAEVPDEHALLELEGTWVSGYRVPWHEPDLGYQLTAVAFHVIGSVPRRLSELPLMFAHETEIVGETPT